eukprot:TRINITY_DN31772_c0_g1_i1.p1 TRINITY_DN31772_c0_g1~~TRINITY_DN31772_c0_g1_i1.p1  ORF type:complete len:360 (-),score=34.77 TRINITY_DN31772_c0_g1_i1:463-1542(-)
MHALSLHKVRQVSFQNVAAALLSLIVFATVIVLQVSAYRERQAEIGALKSRSGMQVDLEQLERLVPNIHHLWACRNPLFSHPDAWDFHLSAFGKDIESNKFGPGDWPRLCEMDSDGDGARNGDEMGDPCCEWQPGVRPAYRVWNLTNPGRAESSLTSAQLKELSPSGCRASGLDASWVQVQKEQFLKQYYMRHESDKHSDDALRGIKYPFLAVIIALLGWWSIRRGLLCDLTGFGKVPGLGAPLGRIERLLIIAGAYVWTDGVAGLTHITFDFCPHSFPILGSVATGFQYHHYHPSAWVVVPYWQMMSHSVPLVGFVSCILFCLPPSRCFRLFWSLTFVVCSGALLHHGAHTSLGSPGT